jgi:hypothetical protein
VWPQRQSDGRHSAAPPSLVARRLPRSRHHLLQFVAADFAHVFGGVARILALEMDVIVRRPLDAVARRPVLGSPGVRLVHISAFQVGDPVAVAAADPWEAKEDGFFAAITLGTVRD